MREIVITGNDAGQRLDRFLQKSLRLPPALMYRYLRKKRIKRNGKRAGGGDVLCEGDTLSLYIGDEFFEAAPPARHAGFPPPRVVYEDENVLVLDKPQGLLSHGGPEEDTLINRVLGYLEAAGGYDPAAEMSFAPALCNRLDRNTGGLVLAAKTAAALRALNAYIRSRSIRKYYSCLVLGCPAPPEGELAGNLHKDGARNVAELREQAGPDAKPVLLRYRVMQRGRRTSLLEVELCTGRPHQIRVQLAGIGCPVAGDPKYGDRALNRALGLRWQALFASRIEFGIPADDPVLGGLAGRTVELPPPIDRCP